MPNLGRPPEMPGDFSCKPKATRLREKHTRLTEPFAMLPLSLLESDAWRTMPRATRLFIDRLIIEHHSHGGADNGRLVVTARDCISWGIRKASVKKTFRDAIARGLVIQTQEGRPNRLKAGRKPNTWQITWLPTHDGAAPTHTWRAYTHMPFPKLSKVYRNSRGKFIGRNPPVLKTENGICTALRGTHLSREMMAKEKVWWEA